MITLDEHYFPSVDDFSRNSPPERELVNGKFDSGSSSEVNQITPFKSRHNEHDHSLIQRYDQSVLSNYETAYLRITHVLRS